MDQAINQLQGIIDFNIIESSMLSMTQHENSYHLEPFTIFGCDESKNFERNNFFSQSPNKLKRQNKNRQYFQQDSKLHKNWSNESLNLKKWNLNEDLNPDDYSFIEQQQIEIFEHQDQVKYEQQEEIAFSAKTQQESKTEERKSQQQSQQLEQEQESQSSRYQRSLKYLSIEMLQIIKNHESILFCSLVQKLLVNYKRHKKHSANKVEDKRTQNIKRRVYDAINVLISSDIIEKYGKKIKLKKRKTKPRRYKASQTQLKKQQPYSKFINEFESKIVEKQRNLEIKRNQLKQLKQRKSNIQRFFNDKKQTHLNVPESQKIKFPFACIKTNQDNIRQIKHILRYKSNLMQQKDNSSTCDSYEEERAVYVTFNTREFLKDVEFQGDIDLAEVIGKLCHQMDEQKHAHPQSCQFYFS